MHTPDPITPGVTRLASFGSGRGEIIVYRIAYEPGERMPTHAHDTASLSVFVRGSYRDRAARPGSPGEHATTWRCLSLALKPADAFHETSIGPEGAVALSVVFPQDLAPGPGSCRWSRAAGPVGSMLALGHACATGALTSRSARDAVGRLWRDASTHARAGEDPPDPALARGAALLEAGHPPGDVARTLGLNPSHFARAFRGAFGCSPTAHATRRRLEQAAELAMHTDTPLARIAWRSGYCDQAHMSNRFSRELGVTPGVMRSLARTIREAPDRG
ncbi:MAG: helix-turn-helix domain-containing protein [Phycisphaerales bacterium JB040]